MRKRVRIDIDYRKDCWWGFKDVGKRLKTMNPGEQYSFLCVPKMAEGMDKVVTAGQGEIIGRDERNYGVVLIVRKK